MPMLERTLDALRRKCDRLLRGGFEVALEFTVKQSAGCDAQMVASYTSRFVWRDDMIWWDTSADQYRPVKLGFNTRRRRYNNGVWMALDAHDPVGWALNALLEDVEDGDVVLVDDPRVFARVPDTDIILCNPPSGCSPDDAHTFLKFTARHNETNCYVCPELNTLQDVALSMLHPLLLGDVIRRNMLDDKHASKWKPVAFPAFRV